MVLMKGQWLTSSNGKFTLEMQQDGNLILYNRHLALWSHKDTSASGDKLKINKNGYLEFYGQDDQLLWDSKTSGDGKYALLKDDSNFVVIDSNGKEVWATGTILSWFLFHLFIFDTDKKFRFF